MTLIRIAGAALAATALMAAPDPRIERSNQYSRILLEVIARNSPEGAGQLGIETVDNEISRFTRESDEQQRQATRLAAQQLKAKLAAEKDPTVRQDLEILIQAAEDGVRSSEVNEKYLAAYVNVPRAVFGGIRSLLDDQISASRRTAAVVRLRKYVGMEKGYRPATEICTSRTREDLKNSKLLPPARVEVEQDLARAQFFVDGLEPLFKKYGVSGYEAPLAKFREQSEAYMDFVKAEVLPKARTDFRLPTELYQLSLHDYGVDIPAEELAGMAHKAFDEIQAEMGVIAAKIAAEKGASKKDYRDVIRELKQDQLVGEAILPHYRARLEQIEAIVKRENLVTLPARPARIRIATAAETAASPAPHMRPPRLIGNTGESGEFVLPLNNPGKTSSQDKYDDFTFAAASWTLACHELRPGHEMQFAALVEKGVSQARAIFAFNSTNVEGWGLYSEAFMKPYLPLEGQLIGLQHRLLRAARAFLDPELQSGKVTPEEASRVLREDVVLSDAMTRQEVERYTFRSPGQATSYFYGFTRLMQLRKDLEKQLGAKFEAKKFHDFVLGQGLLPPALLRKAAMSEFAGT